MPFNPEVAIIGAGPYGLSIAAHLRARGVTFRIFGSPMHSWLTQMPKGMCLKSEGFASTLYDADNSFTLAHFCAQQGIPYADLGLPVRLETFASYGLAFQQRFVPELENKAVVALERSVAGFRLHLADGEVVNVHRVLVAVGLSYFQYVLPILAELPGAFVSHSSDYGVLDRFKGRDVTVIGGGSSAADLAALLHQAGATVQVVARQPWIHFASPMRLPRPFWDRIRRPMSGLAPGWRSRLCTDAPLVFHRMPEKFRLEIVRRHLGPSAGWFVKDQVVGRVPLILGSTLKSATVRRDRVHLQLTHDDGTERELVTEHVITATGYKVDLRRLPFLNEELRALLRSVEHTPILSSNFESSIPGLYFVGPAAANSFGPLLRFVFGAGFTARRLSRHLARSASRRARPLAGIASATADRSWQS